MTTSWRCEHCAKSGFVEHSPDESPWGLVQKIRDAHDRLSPLCTFNPKRVKIDYVPGPAPSPH